MKQRILIIEDDSAIAAIERDYLEINDYKVDIASDGEAGLSLALENNYDLILLDIMIPKIDGFTLCKRLRETLDIPILIVSAKTEDFDKIRGLGLGADDYIVKPFSPSELVARVKANISQYERLRMGTASKSELKVGELRINTQSHTLHVSDKLVELKNREYELLLFLVTNPGMVFTRDTLYERIWGYDAMGDSATVSVHISRLREKIEADPSNPKYIQTVWGVGYRFRALDDTL